VEKSDLAKDDSERQDILNSLERGEITSEEAALRLRKSKK
jgi:hypothetical protein